MDLFITVSELVQG